ncbi:MAG TPA: dihydrodipicolinate synthase family protein [Thermoplasmata archaeon]|nr:dihydrodipicolinate synthase family protein [Thermoplasmata archaeon]
MSGRAGGAGVARGVLVALTTPFGPDGRIEIDRYVVHARWVVEHGCRGVIVGGSLGEGASLGSEEHVALVRALAKELPESAPVVAAVGASRTAAAVEGARAARDAGASGLLVLPPYVYHGDRRETRAHLATVLGATDLPAIAYNNPAAYGVDLAPEDVLRLAEEASSLVAVKESSGDVRRITALRELLGERVDVAVGLDDLLLEGVGAGAVGWVAGLANALPTESAVLFERAAHGPAAEARTLYDWFLPLLRLDTGPKFVQAIKLVETELGVGTAAVRAPRYPLEGPELESTLGTVRAALARRPVLGRHPASAT